MVQSELFKQNPVCLTNPVCFMTLSSLTIHKEILLLVNLFHHHHCSMTKSTPSATNRCSKRKKQSLSPVLLEPKLLTTTPPVSTNMADTLTTSPLDCNTGSSLPSQKHLPSLSKISEDAHFNPLPLVPEGDLNNQSTSTKFHQVQYIDDDSDDDILEHNKPTLPPNLKSTGTEMTTNEDANTVIVTPSKSLSAWDHMPVETSLLFAPTTPMPPLMSPLLTAYSCEASDPPAKKACFDAPLDNAASHLMQNSTNP